MSFASQNGIRTLNVAFTQSKLHREQLAALISLRLPKRCHHSQVVEMLAKVEGIFYIEEI